jgi:long-chain fatty acid transport protein
MTDNAFFGANNPATAAFAGNRLDLGVDLFSPKRKASRTGSGGAMVPPPLPSSQIGGVLPINGDGGNFMADPNDPNNYSFTGLPGDYFQLIPAIDGESESGSDYFLVPEFGYNYMYSPNLALGITVYGNGGMNTDYKKDQLGGMANILGGNTKLGVDLMQLIVAPTIAYKFHPNHSVGISPLLGYQRFEAKGLQAFGLISQDPSNVTNNDHDDSFGFGVRVGYYGKLTPAFSVGAAYASKMAFEEFDDYKGLFAEGGDFDIPENWNLGLAWQATPSLLIGLDYQRINYSGVDSVSNPSDNFFGCVFPNGLFVQPFGVDPMGGGNAGNSYCLGGNNGSGFGWDDINIWKIGAEYKYSKQWTFRAGYSHTDNPISKADAEFNILAPAVIQDHVTVGFTYTLASGDEVTMAYMHGFENDVKGPSLFFGGQDKIEMYQNSLGIQYSWKM